MTKKSKQTNNRETNFKPREQEYTGTQTKSIMY